MGPMGPTWRIPTSPGLPWAALGDPELGWPQPTGPADRCGPEAQRAAAVWDVPAASVPPARLSVRPSFAHLLVPCS